MKWIPLSERKPDKTDRYIIYSGDVYAADYNEKYDAWSDDNQIVSYEITHWMPMPPLPEPEKPKDPDWEKFEKDFNRMHYDNDEMSDLAACVFAIYRFLKAKYGN